MLNLLFPRLCPACEMVLSQGERDLCTTCRHELPQTNYHLFHPNPVEQLFQGRIALQKATAFLKFQPNNKVQHLLHELKYHGQQSIGTCLGHWFGALLYESHFFGKIDFVIPVPISKQRHRLRGYNQVRKFAEALSLQLRSHCVTELLVKTKDVQSQVTLNANERAKILFNTFSINEDSPVNTNSRILLVDDLITTGATLESCAKTLNNAAYHHLSIAAIAITDNT